MMAAIPFKSQKNRLVRRSRGRPWRRLRESVLSAEPLCRSCAAQGLTFPAAEVDHIVPLHTGGTDAPDNLQPLCVQCHQRKTAAELRHDPPPDWAQLIEEITHA